jgi:P22 coat protein - gene protein 5
MPNTFITPSVIAQRALATLYNDALLAALVYRDYDSDFTGKQGDTVNVRVPVVFQADDYDRTVGIVIQNATEDRFPIVLDKLADVSFSVTSEEMLLDIDDFAGRLLTPAMEAINQKVDGDLADELIAASQQHATPGSPDYVAQQAGGGTVVSADPHEPLKALVAARVKLGRGKLPTLNRSAVLSPEGAGAALEGSLIVQANQRGDTDGLVEASIGRKFGFDTFESQVLGDQAGGAGRHTADGVAFHRDAIAFATRALQIPLGKQDSNGDTVGAAIAQYKGMGLRVVYDYDVNKKQDVISIDFLYGVRAVRPQGAVELDLGQGS